MRPSCALRHRFLLTLLAGAVLITAVVPAGAAASQSRQPTAATERIDPDDFSESLLAEAIFQETNQQRARLGLPAFLPDEKVSKAARAHARWMANTHRLSHDEPTIEGTPLTPFERLVQQGLRPHLASENIAYNLLPDIVPGKLFYTRLVNDRPVYSYRSDGPAIQAHTYEGFARVVLAQWMHSPPHRAHLADPELRFLGIGVALAHRRKHPDTIYVAQDFFTPHTFWSGTATSAVSATLSALRP